MPIRLNKYLSKCGAASRREADRMILSGRVRVNGRVVSTLGAKIDEEKDIVELDGQKIVKKKSLIYLVLNKPPGYVVTRKDPTGRPTVMDLIPVSMRHLYSVGRLDYDSRGLLLLTNDGELAHRLMHPRYEIWKSYLVKVKGMPDADSIKILEKGIFLEGKKTAPAHVTRIKSSPERSLMKIELREGRKHEVKKMWAAVGHPVLDLKRIELGGIKLDRLKPGKWRDLTKKEVDLLKAKTGL
ncbi:MAG: rRNA pseudouridine synthase [Candidatus Aminicenantes bacterium]|nr:rRNA pseudouridine synthase [Candidatus Aminicenantes bacterium]